MVSLPDAVPIEFCPLAARNRSAAEPRAVTPEWRCDIPGPLLSTIQAGVMRTMYKGRVCLKSPFDVMLYLRLLQQLRPRSIVEIGTQEGGGALLLADMLCMLGAEARVLSVDVKPPPPIDDPRIVFLTGNAAALDAALPPALLASLPHPWLVIEDSAHLFETSLAVLKFFDRLLEPGDYIVVEDGIVAFLPEAAYARYDNGPNRAVAQFLRDHADAYDIDRSLCDFYGGNVTYNPNGWLRRRRSRDE